jgi:pyridoxal phosphate enzyme (YggS family)
LRLKLVTSNHRAAAETVAANYRSLQQEVADACRLANRSHDEVKIIGVSKYVDAATTRLLVDAGCVNLGESRPQTLAAKADDPAFCDQPVTWHQIGHLQRNKVDMVVVRGALIHSVDSQRVLAAIAASAQKQCCVCRVLVEVNCSGEEAKTGIAPHELPDMLDAASQLDSVRVEGLMTMAAREGDARVARDNFAALRILLETARTTHRQLPLRELSMGMSGDFAEAIAEGATMIRVGSRLWHGLAGHQQ